MTEQELSKLHSYSFENGEDLKNSETASCFHCLSTYPVGLIMYCTEEKSGKVTAICPKCDIDSVIPGNKNVTPEQLKELQQHYF